VPQRTSSGDRWRQRVVAKQLNAACPLGDYEAAKRALDRLDREPKHMNPSACGLGEGMEESLTGPGLTFPPNWR